MKQAVAVLERAVGYALAFARYAALGLALAGLLVAASRALQTPMVWSWLASTSSADVSGLAPLALPLNWTAAFVGWFAVAVMAYLVVGWLQRALSGRKPGFLEAVGAALGAGLPLLVVSAALALMLWLAPFPTAGGAHWGYQIASLVALALLLPAMVFAAARARGFRDALGRLAEALSASGYGRLLIRPGYWAALAVLALWLLASSWLGRVGLQLDLDRALEPQFFGFLFAEALRGFLTTIIGLPIVAAALRSVYDVVWGTPEPASATPAPPAA